MQEVQVVGGWHPLPPLLVLLVLPSTSGPPSLHALDTSWAASSVRLLLHYYPHLASTRSRLATDAVLFSDCWLVKDNFVRQHRLGKAGVIFTAQLPSRPLESCGPREWTRGLWLIKTASTNEVKSFPICNLRYFGPKFQTPSIPYTFAPLCPIA